MVEKFRILRHDRNGVAHVGVFEGENVKRAVEKAVYHDAKTGVAGVQKYEAHVLRNASVWSSKSRNEQFIDKLNQENTQDEFGL